MKRQQTKPRLTKEQIKNCPVFSLKWLNNVHSGETFYYCFLDEKWFYTTSLRKKEKHFPPADFESLIDSFIELKKVRSQCFPCKVMYMGIVGPTIKGKSNGKIMMRRVSILKTAKSESFNQNFSPYYDQNNQLKLEEWKKLVPVDGKIQV